MTERAYLDHNATSPVRPEVRAATAEALGRVGNPSSVHAEGRAARAAVERAREQVAALVGARLDDVTFTSGGTEANAAALRPGALAGADGRPVTRVAIGATEHASVLDGHSFPGEATMVLAVGRDGVADLGGLDAALSASAEPLLVSLQAANGETGVLQPVRDIAERVRAGGGALHCDAVQAAGRIPLDMRSLGIDALALSGHKLGAAPGIGALIVASERVGPARPLLRGGGQEARRRAGTENVPAIVGFGVAASLAAAQLDSERVRVLALRDAAEAGIRRLAPDAVVFGAGTERLPNTVAFAVPGLSAETALMALDLGGVAVSSGSACSSGKVARSHVLAAMGVSETLARGAIRLSFGWSSSEADVGRFGRAFETLLQRLYTSTRARAA